MLFIQNQVSTMVFQLILLQLIRTPDKANKFHHPLVFVEKFLEFGYRILVNKAPDTRKLTVANVVLSKVVLIN